MTLECIAISKDWVVAFLRSSGFNSSSSMWGRVASPHILIPL